MQRLTNTSSAVTFKGKLSVTSYKNGKPRLETYTTSKEVDSLAKRIVFDVLPKNVKTTELTRKNSTDLKTLVELITGKTLKSNECTKQTITRPKYNKFIYEDIYTKTMEESNLKRNGVCVMFDFNA